jgi:hypothetical protein
MPHTETRLKLLDAGTQLRLALAAPADEATVRSCINAFISAARSVTLVMQRESGEHAALGTWYELQQPTLASIPLFRFFNQQRVYSIHKGVVQPGRQAMPLSGLSHLLNVPPEKADEAWAAAAGPEAGRPIMLGDMLFSASADTLISWRFLDVEAYLPGDSGDVFRLCRTYYTYLDALVAEWERQLELSRAGA